MADVIELVRAFAALAPSVSPVGGLLRYQAIPVPSSPFVSLSKSAAGEAVLLIHTAPSLDPLPAPLRLEHLTVQHGVSGSVHLAQDRQQGTYSLVLLKGATQVLVEMFLRFATAVAQQVTSQPTATEVAALLQRFVSLLQNLRKPNMKVIQGLWAELFVMTTQSDPGRWVSGWHTDPMGLHDFVFGAMRVEVKSSASGERVHRFSHRQPFPPIGASFFLASVLVERAGLGSSVFRLAEELHPRLSPELSLVLDSGIAAALGADYGKADEHRFDESRARDSLRYFPLSAIPRLQADVPGGVTEISYSVRLADGDGEPGLTLA